MESFTKRLLRATGLVTLTVIVTYGVFWSAREVGRVYTKTEACYQAVFSNPEGFNADGSKGTVGIKDRVDAVGQLLVGPLTDADNKPVAVLNDGKTPLSRLVWIDMNIAESLRRTTTQQPAQRSAR